MFEKQFKVIALNNNKITLEPIDDKVCSNCAGSQSCGINVLAGFFKRNIEIDNSKAYKVNDIITLKISTKKLYKQAFYLLILPLLNLFIFAYLARVITDDNDFWQALFGFTAFIGTFVFLRFKI